MTQEELDRRFSNLEESLLKKSVKSTDFSRIEQNIADDPEPIEAQRHLKDKELRNNDKR